ncbi:MAG: hypothetical protein WCJ13_11565, partial [Coriobacteriia bacterium]
MQDSGPTSPIEREPGLTSWLTESQQGGATSLPADLPNREKPPRPQRTSDPVVRWLTLAIVAVIVFWLVSVLSAAFFGLLSRPPAPRTQAERDLLTLTETVQSGKASSQTYAQYVGVLINAGQLSKAQQALDGALKIAKSDRSFLHAQQAQLALMRRDYKGAVAAADVAMAEARKELTAFMDKNVENNRRRDAGAVMPTSFADAALAQAGSAVVVVKKQEQTDLFG